MGRPSARYFGRAAFGADPVNHRVVGTVAGGCTDFVRQIAPAGTDTWNYGNTKGGSLGPWYKVEFDTLAPPYLLHNSSAKDGAGDFSLLLKYRLAAGSADNGDYSVSFSWAGTLPTGSYKHGNLAATVSPTLGAGKGFGCFDVQSTQGSVLPAGDTSKLGRPVVWNAVGAISYRQVLWPEIENNATFYTGGPNDGGVQNFVTPGLMPSECRLEHDPRNRLRPGPRRRNADCDLAISYLQPRPGAYRAEVVLGGRASSCAGPMLSRVAPVSRRY